MIENSSLFYTIVGILVIGNLSNIVLLFVFIFKAGRFVQKIETGIKVVDDKSNRAHKRVDKEEKLRMDSMERHESRYHPI